MKKVLYYNGNILTMDKSKPRREALLVENGIIKALGNFGELGSIVDDSTELCDLSGMTLMPAFVDGHSHVIMFGSMVNQCYLGECKSFDDILATIKEYRNKNGLTHGEKIRCYGYDLAVLKEGRHPTAKDLDRLGVDNPIGCTHVSFHMGVYNSVAMRAAGVDENYTFTGSGVVGRDENGKPNGYFEESARRVMSTFMNSDTSESFEECYLSAEKEYFKNGITTIQEGGSVNEEKLIKFKALSDKNKITADLVLYLEPRLKDTEFWDRACGIIDDEKSREHLKIGGVKIVLDGSPQAKTAWMTKPYENEIEYSGYPNHKDETVYTLLSRATKKKMQVLAHCNGDAAAEQFVSSWERVVLENPDATSLRPVMIHAQTVRYDQLKRMAKTNMIPSFFVGHTYYWGDTHLKNFGKERAEKISPVKAALDIGLKPNFHQDSPVTFPNMLHSVWCAVNRVTRSGAVIGEENRIDVYDALIAATNGGAYEYFEENKKGILKSGAVADLIILDKDPTTIDPMQIKDIRVLKTIKAGRVVFEQN